MKGKAIAIAILCCLCLVADIFAANWVVAQERLFGSSRGSGPFVSEPVIPGVSREVWRLPAKEPRSPADPVRIFPRRPGNYEADSTGSGSRMIDSLAQEPDGESAIRTPSPDLSFEGMSPQLLLHHENRQHPGDLGVSC